MSARGEIAKLIDAYLAAYEAANGRPFPGTVTYERGWFRFRRDGVTTNARIATIRDWTGNLRYRASQQEDDTE